MCVLSMCLTSSLVFPYSMCLMIRVEMNSCGLFSRWLSVSNFNRFMVLINLSMSMSLFSTILLRTSISFGFI